MRSGLSRVALLTLLTVGAVGMSERPALAQGGGGLTPEQTLKAIELKIRASELELKINQAIGQTKSSKVTRSLEKMKADVQLIKKRIEKLLT